MKVLSPNFIFTRHKSSINLLSFVRCRPRSNHLQSHPLQLDKLSLDHSFHSLAYRKEMQSNQLLVRPRNFIAGPFSAYESKELWNYLDQ